MYKNITFYTLLSFFYTSALSAHYWSDTQRKGTNFFNETEVQERFDKAKAYGIEFVRLSPDKWHSDSRDFLLGDVDEFNKIDDADLQRLSATLDMAENANMKVIITTLSLPCSRWLQNNGGKDDVRLWESYECWDKAIDYWSQIALHLKNHPAVVGYNLLNEPHPERVFTKQEYNDIDFTNWQDKVQNTPADLNAFYEKLALAIRKVDPDTPIILDTGLYATPWAIEYLKPIDMNGILYSFHMYEPFSYTNKKLNQQQYVYPGLITYNNQEQFWEFDALNAFFSKVTQWQEKHSISSRQILVGEFGVSRRSPGAEQYLADLTNIFNENDWHWAFYSFREDTWDDMDYELGTKNAGWAYWQAIESHNLPPESSYKPNNPLFAVLLEAMKP